MPSSIGHSLAGYAVYLGSTRSRKRFDLKVILLFLIVSNLPDIDFLLGFVVGKPNIFHHQFTHSLSFAVFTGLVFGVYSRVVKLNSFANSFSLFTGLICSHLLLDFFTLDTSAPYGEQLFWPLTNKYFVSPVTIFHDIRRASTPSLFLWSLFSKHNLYTTLIECAIIMPIIVAVLVLEKLGLYKHA